MDAEKIRDWYDERSIKVGKRFIEEMDCFIAKIDNNPYQFRKINAEVRRCLMNIFPYIIYFFLTEDKIVILRIRHYKQRTLKRFT